MRVALAKYSNSIMTAIMLAIFIAFVTTAGGYPAEARFMPWVVGLPAIAIGVLQLILDARDRRRPAEPEDERSDLEKAEEEASRILGHHVDLAVHEQKSPAEVATAHDHVRRELIVWVYIVSYVAGVVLFGFRPAIPIFLVTFLRFYAHLSWRNALLAGLAGTLVLWVIFERVLGMQLHDGLITEYVLDWING